MGKRGFSYLAGKHAGNLGGTLFFGKTMQVGFGNAVSPFPFAHKVVPLAAHGDLRQVRDDDDLVRAGKRGQNIGQRHGGRASHAGVNLVEHERVDVVVAAKHHLHGQHDAADLSSRGYASKRTRLHARTRAEKKLHRR